MALPAIALWVLCLAWAGPARADSTGSSVSHEDFRLVIDVEGIETVLTFLELAERSQGVELPDENSTTAALTDGIHTSESNFILTWDRLEFDPDPFINFVGSFTNNLGTATDFTLSMLAAVAPLTDSLIGGSTFVTVADANFDGVGTIKNITGLAGYSGSIDGADVLDLLDPFDATVPFAGGTAGTNDSAGLPGPTIAGGAVAATIGITHRFNLTSSDSATFNSTFQVVVPEPGTALLLGFGILGLAFVRQRRV